MTNTLSLPFSCDICAETFRRANAGRVRVEGREATTTQNAGTRRTDLKKHGLVHTEKMTFARIATNDLYPRSNLNKLERQHTGV